MSAYIKGIFDLILGEQNFDGSSLLFTPATFNASLYSYVMTVMNSVIKPIAYAVLALFCLLELYQITVRNTDSTRSFEVPFKLMFKTVICKIVVDKSDVIVSALFDVSSSVITGIQGVLGTPVYTQSGALVDMDEIIDAMGFGEQLMLALIATLLFIGFQVLTIFVTVTITGRMLEIYVLTAIAPLPLATFPNEHMRNTGINFLKYFFAVCLQGALMFLVLSLFKYLTFDPIVNVAAAHDYLSLTLGLFAVLGDLVVLFLAIKKSGSWAKSICNAM
ncbi:MAG: hypothetical protein MJ225_03965 [Bacilli bacterium]|nr:hypothetical protein [Bacilli bacterium]